MKQTNAESHEHAWTWADDDSDLMVCDDCGAEKFEMWNPDLGVYESTDYREGPETATTHCVECGHADAIQGCWCRGNDRLNLNPCPCVSDWEGA